MSSSDDAAIWRRVGHDLIQFFVAVTVETFFIGIYTVLVFKTGTLLLYVPLASFRSPASHHCSPSRGKRGTMVSILTCASVFVMYAIALVLWIIDIHNVVVEIRMMLIRASTSTDSLGDVYSTTVFKVLSLTSLENVLYAYMSNIGDGIIVWRVYAFWSIGREKLVLLIPIACLLGSIASSMVITYCAARLGADSVLGTYQHPVFCRNIQTTSYAMALATSAAATLLIAYKTWEYRNIHHEAFGNTLPQTRTQKIMMFLIESGILYVLFFLVQVIMSLESVNESINRSLALTLAFTVYQFITSLIVGMYPTVVLLLINSKHSMLDSISAATHSVSLSHKNTRGTSHTAYLHTSSSATSVPTHAALKTVDLYEMARFKSTSGGEELHVKNDTLTPGRGQHSINYYAV
ncbi:hypothetical protein C8Q76DRAFT_731352 [Earliella scabrosa]|nr:hypothetical protein C8Q76DRAFT_731352 [Earliella scabrosa]